MRRAVAVSLLGPTGVAGPALPGETLPASPVRLFWPPVEPRLETVRRCLAPEHIVMMHLHPDEKATIAERIARLDPTLPPIVVPSERMSEVVLP